MYDIEEIKTNRIDDNEMNHQLSELYASKSDYLIEAIAKYSNTKKEEEHDATNPYYLAVTNEYAKANHRVMIFGQDTYTWGGEFGQGGKFNSNTPISDLMSLYDKFVNKDSGYSSPFWNYCRKLKNNSDSNVQFVYNNIIKLGLTDNAGCNFGVYEINKGLNLIKDEISILKPDLLIFLSGANYDYKIDELIGSFGKNTVSEKYTDREYAKLIFEDRHLPESFRTYHPGYLQRNVDYYNDVYVSLLDNINHLRNK